MKSVENGDEKIAETRETAAQPEWTTPRFEVLDVACQTQSAAAGADDGDQIS